MYIQTGSRVKAIAAHGLEKIDPSTSHFESEFLRLVRFGIEIFGRESRLILDFLDTVPPGPTTIGPLVASYIPSGSQRGIGSEDFQ